MGGSPNGIACLYSHVRSSSASNVQECVVPKVTLVANVKASFCVVSAAQLVVLCARSSSSHFLSLAVLHCSAVLILSLGIVVPQSPIASFLTRKAASFGCFMVFRPKMELGSLSSLCHRMDPGSALGGNVIRDAKDASFFGGEASEGRVKDVKWEVTEMMLHGLGVALLHGFNGDKSIKIYYVSSLPSHSRREQKRTYVGHQAVLSRVHVSTTTTVPPVENVKASFSTATAADLTKGICGSPSMETEGAMDELARVVVTTEKGRKSPTHNVLSSCGKFK
ncbi:hypothetical protein V8G54_001999 [Vigna mungo]|uniref:Uncharacterized protein n=1 Tax=Vigna mungo TaxID=3915 RepID=A0AAQ3P9E5_VIGMU